MTTATETTERSRKAEQADRTRANLMQVARTLFAERGYAGSATEEIVQQAGVTRGALYHHFRDKRDLFEAVFVEVQQEMRERIGAASRNAGDEPWHRFRAGFDVYLDHSMDPTVRRILLLDAPSVLGWERWREIDASLAMLRNGLTSLRASGDLDPSMGIEEVAHLLRGVASEAAHMIALASDPAETRQAVGDAVDRLLRSIRA
ncbi:MAG: TetR/AcrR family transcriptional regulator [Chloroflexi bacterium]|nr:TetR/AcrR family transcriptional regulator [Chloroflexota bacterium]